MNGEASSAVVDTVKIKGQEILTEMIEDKGYIPQQIFSVDERELFWKCMPSRSYTVKRRKIGAPPSFKTDKDRLTLLFGGNASGNLTLKSMP